MIYFYWRTFFTVLGWFSWFRLHVYVQLCDFSNSHSGAACIL